MHSLKAIGSFRSDPLLENVTEIVYRAKKQSRELNELIEQVSLQTIFVLPIIDFPFYAKYDMERSTIYINLNLGGDETASSYGLAKKVHAFIMELCNAAYFKQHLFAALGKLKFGIDGYVEEVERGEYRLLHKTNRIFKQIKESVDEFRGYKLEKPFRDFTRHYLQQQLYGHSEWIAKVSLHPGLYRGTWRHPVNKEQDRLFLKSVISDFKKRGESSDLLGRVESIKHKVELYENALQFIKGDEAFPELSEETALYPGEIVSRQSEERGLLSYVRSQLSEYWPSRGVLQILSNLYYGR
jgi:hypothetical protein